MAVAYDEVSVSTSCEKLKIENLGYDCKELIKQSAPKAFAVTDIERDSHLINKEITKFLINL